MIFEGLMALGSFDLRLADDTPQQVKDDIWYTDTIVVTPARISVGEVDRAGLLSQARYRGFVLNLEGGTSVGGAGMQWVFDNGYGGGGFVDKYLSSADPKTWAQHIAQISANPILGTESSLGRLTTSAVGVAPTGSWPADDVALNDLPPMVGERLRVLAKVFGAEWRVTPAGTFLHSSAGDLTLWQQNRVILNPRESGRDLDLIGFDDVEMVQQFDGRSRVVSSYKEYDHAAFAAQGYVDGLNPIGGFDEQWSHDGYPFNIGSGPGPAIHATVASGVASDLTDAVELAEAEAALNREKVITKVSARQEDPGRYIRPGDFLWLDDPLQGLRDLGQATMWRGMERRPAKRRLFGMRWGVTDNMGVYRLRRAEHDLSGRDPSEVARPQIVDLSDFVVPEDDRVELEVGALARSAFD